MKLIITIILILSIFLMAGCNSTQECNGGRVVNTLNGEVVNHTIIPATCYDNETNIGEMKELDCPCICCMPK